MIAALLILSLLLPPQTPVEQHQMYETVLQSLRSEYTDVPLYLANPRLENLRPIASEGATGDSLKHDPEWVQELEESGVISGSCVPPKFFLGCPAPESLEGQPFVAVNLWLLADVKGSRVTVPVTLALPPLRKGVANAEKREYILTRTSNGRWQVESYKVVGVT